MPVAGNPQVNIRLEPELYSAVKESAESQGIKPHEWIRRVIKEKLGLGLPVAVATTATDLIALTELENRLGAVEGELENISDPAPLIDSLREELLGEIENLKKL